MPYRPDRACQYCQHALNDHNRHVGCPHCACAATPGEGNGELVELLPADQCAPGYQPRNPAPAPEGAPEDDERIREMRWTGRGSGTWPGKVEHGCLHPTYRDGPLDRVSIYPHEKTARDEVASWSSRGVPAFYVTRTLPDWTAPDLGTEAAPDPATVQDAIDLIAAAGALGMDLPTPAGLTVWTVECGSFEETTATLGPYSSEAAAMTALRNWIVDQWDLPDTGPWSTSADSDSDDAPDIDPDDDGSRPVLDPELAAARAAWLAEHSDADVRAAYAAQYRNEWTRVLPGKVLPAPTPTV